MWGECWCTGIGIERVKFGWAGRDISLALLPHGRSSEDLPYGNGVQGEARENTARLARPRNAMGGGEAA
eukprot:5393637-Pyramimonas_sp.AAC.1